MSARLLSCLVHPSLQVLSTSAQLLKGLVSLRLRLYDMGGNMRYLASFRVEAIQQAIDQEQAALATSRKQLMEAMNRSRPKSATLRQANTAHHIVTP